MATWTGAAPAIPPTSASPVQHIWAGVTPEPATPAPAAIYRMRAYDTTLATIVYWDSGTPNTAEYGGPGPLTNLVIV